MCYSQLPMPPATANLQTAWAFLEKGIDHIMRNSTPTGVSFTHANYDPSHTPINIVQSIQLSTVVYNYMRTSEFTSEEKIGRYIPSGANLYRKLIQYFATLLEGPRDETESLQEETLLRYYAAEWSRYAIGAHRVDHIFTHLNRHWTKRERDEGRKYIYPVCTLALVQWKDTLFIPIQMKLTSAILRLIEDQRNGSAIDQDLVKKVVDSFVSLGLDGNNTKKVCLDVYREYFELLFIDATEPYYKQEAETFLASHSLSDYLKKAEERLQEEEGRVERYLNGQTRQPLISKCEQVLIRERAALMWDGFQGLLDSDRDEDLQRMYSLLSRIPEGLEPLQKKFEQHIEKTGLAAISKLVGEAGSSTESLDPKIYVDALLEIHQKYSETVTKSFRGDSGFVESLDKACREFVNRNAVTSQSNSTSSELFSDYLDLLLRKNNNLAGKGDLEMALNRVMVLFKYIEDKDSFQTSYTTKLLERLIYGLSASDESEAIVISQLKGTYGFKYTKLQRSLQGLLNFDRDDILQRLFSVLSRIPGGLEPMHSKFEEHAKNAGLAALSKLVEEAGSSASLDPKVYVDTLLTIHQKNSETVARIFGGEPGFLASLDNACREFVNRNAATGQSDSKSPELIAKHADLLLRKNNRLSEENDLEVALNRVIILCKYIEDKDIFQTFYATKLSKRLIHGVSVSDESEASMISKLKVACGVEYTHKLQRMFTDMSLSKALTDSFKSRMKQNHDVDISFSIMVLSSNWPLNPPIHKFLIPAEIIPIYDRFQEYFQMKHSGRKLIWLWNYSKNELQTNYLNQKYILMTSSFQMAVLLQYNNVDTLSLSELVQATSIPKELLSQVLALLVRATILINEETEQYDLNPNFKSKKIRINLNLPIKAETMVESVEVLKMVAVDRKYIIEAAIVRIMKARKTMDNQLLVQEVISQTSQTFVPKILDIKKAIDALLEKEYIVRMEGRRDTFSYVA